MRMPAEEDAAVQRHCLQRPLPRRPRRERITRSRAFIPSSTRVRCWCRLKARRPQRRQAVVVEAAQRGIGMRVIKDQRVAYTSTSDLTPRGLDRFLQDALELVEI